MTWLFPLYLLGGAAIIGPILMHLRRRPPQDRVEFSSLMFLDAQTPMPVSKRRLENWLLLLLRCLALLLLALMFARPLWRVENEGLASQNQATVLLLDRSASMRRGDLWQQALAAATQRLEKMGVTDRLSVATLDRETKRLWSFDQDKNSTGTRLAVLKPQLAALKPGWSSTDLGKALVDAAGWFGGSQGLSGLKKRIIVITDFQEGARIDALRGMVWPESIAVEIVTVAAPKGDNFTLSLAANAEESASGKGAATTTRVRLSNTRDSKVNDFKIAWEKSTEPPVTGYLPPGASRVISLPGIAGTLTLTGDAWDFDNRIYMAPAQPKAVRIAFIGDEKTRSEAASPLFYLSRAIQPTPSIRPELVIVPDSATALPAGAELVFISGAKLSAPLVKAVHSLVENGGLAIVVITPDMKTQDLEALANLKGIQLVSPDKPGLPDDYQMLSDVQVSHPLLRPFADERLHDFTKLRFWKHRRLTISADALPKFEMLARFDQGDPAILSRTLNKGRLVLLTSGWHPADSQLALSTKFVPLLYGWLEAAGFRNEQAASLVVGDVLPLEGASSIMTPDGLTLTPKPGDAVRAEMPGVYQLKTGKRTELRAVNISPEEGRITPMDIAKLRELGVRVEEGNPAATASAKAEDKERLAITEQEARQRAWIWLLGALLAILAWETWLAGRIRQGTLQPAYSSP